MRLPKRIGVIASSNGGVFTETVALLESAGYSRHFEFFVITDRPCGIEEASSSLNIRHKRIEEADRELFSEKAAEFASEQGKADAVVLFFLRLIGSAIHSRFPTYNIHPSLLPAFSGFRPLEQALKARVRFAGATLHVANADADSGPIVAQACMPISPESTSLQQLQKISFLQKTYLMLILLEAIRLDALETSAQEGHLRWKEPTLFSVTDRANPALAASPLLDAFKALQEREGVAVI